MSDKCIQDRLEEGIIGPWIPRKAPRAPTDTVDGYPLWTPSPEGAQEPRQTNEP